jgi:hypothetical protein
LRLIVETLEDRALPSFALPVTYGAELAVQGLAAADFNGDGAIDLAAVNTATNTVSVLLGSGGGAFQTPRTSVTGSEPKSLVAGDLNGDGWTDLVTCNANDVSLLLGNNDGTFQPPQALRLLSQFPPGYTGLDPVFQRPTSVTLGDLNRDGEVDLVATGESLHPELIGHDGDEPVYQYITNGYINTLVGDGHGSFSAGSSYHRGQGNARGLALGDLNGDDWLDVLTDGAVLLGNGGGTLQASRPAPLDISFISNPAGDFNHDGNLDVASARPFGAVLLLGNGDGTFQDAGSMSQCHAVADVNADGNLDVIVMRNDFVYSGYDEATGWIDPVTTRSVRVQLGLGNGSFGPPLDSVLDTLAGYYFLLSPVLADFDGDGFPDLAATESFSVFDGNGVYQGVHVMHNDSAWTLPPPSPPPSIRISEVVRVTEGNTGTRAATFGVTLSHSWRQPVSVAFATSDGSATAGSDYQGSSDNLTFAPGEFSKTITVLINGDRIPELHETLFVNLSSPSNAIIDVGQGLVDLTDDEPRVSISDVSKTEGKKGKTIQFTFTVSLSVAYDQPVTMSFRTVNGTATTSDGDYIAKTGTLTFAPGETSKTITIDVKGDARKEANETFYLDLFGLSGNALFTKNRGTGTILNDD